jgi:Tol biopolymer transport system component
MFAILATLAVLASGPPSQAATAEADVQEAKHLRNIRQVTSGFARAGEGYFRPDGQAIIFQAVRNTPPAIFASPRPNQDDYQIFAGDLAPDARPRMVSTGKGKCTCAYFHPDGKSILFASSHLDPALAEGAKPPDYKPKTPAYSRSERYRWDFDPHMDIFRADPDGSNLVRLTDSPGYDAEGSYSPDGRQIVFTSFRDGDAEIYIMDADGKNPRRITHAKGYDGGPFFSPDGKRLIYRSDRKNNDLLQVYINNTEGTGERALTDNEFVNWGPYWHPDNRHIIYATSRHGHQNYELYLMDVDTGAEERITYREGFDGLPVFSPDGKRLMWTSSGRTANKQSQLFLADFVMDGEPQAAGR